MLPRWVAKSTDIPTYRHRRQFKKAVLFMFSSSTKKAELVSQPMQLQMTHFGSTVPKQLHSSLLKTEHCEH